jgi:hypothetical protein
MSDLSRLRARWVRLEQRIAKLERDLVEYEDDADMTQEITVKLTKARDALTHTIALTGIEERRLFRADSKLKYSNI